MNQELFEKHLCNQNSHYEKYFDFHYEGKPLHATTKLTPFAVSKDEWDTKEDAGNPQRTHCVYCSMPKGISQAEATLEREKIKP